MHGEGAEGLALQGVAEEQGLLHLIRHIRPRCCYWTVRRASHPMRLVCEEGVPIAGLQWQTPPAVLVQKTSQVRPADHAQKDLLLQV